MARFVSTNTRADPPRGGLNGMGYGKFDSARRAEYLQSLMGDSLCGNRKIYPSALAKVDDPADNPINFELWIEICECDCAARFTLENES
jgi:hypothetical protein